MKDALTRVDALSAEVRLLIRSNDFRNIRLAYEVIDYDYRNWERSRPVFDRQVFPTPDWEEKFENNLQSLGARVSEASAQANTLHLQKRRNRRRSTISGLAEIGIRKLVAKIRSEGPLTAGR